MTAIPRSWAWTPWIGHPTAIPVRGVRDVINADTHVLNEDGLVGRALGGDLQNGLTGVDSLVVGHPRVEAMTSGPGVPWVRTVEGMVDLPAELTPLIRRGRFRWTA